MNLMNFDDSQKDIDTYIELHNDIVSSERRALLKNGLAVSGLLSLSGLGIFVNAPALAKNAFAAERELRVFTPNLGETSRIVYWVPGEGYILDSLKEISWALRDRRENTARLYDPHVLDQLFAMSLQLEYEKPVHILSGYRSTATNAMLRRKMRGVARDSLHMKAKALDIRMPGRQNNQIYKTAMALRAGGVGFYGRSNFTHIDSGALRSWKG